MSNIGMFNLIICIIYFILKKNVFKLVSETSPDILSSPELFRYNIYRENFLSKN